MASREPPRVLFFDVFGTCVAQRIPVTDELCNAAKQALARRDSNISPQVRQRARDMTYEKWREVMEEWNSEEGKFVRDNIKEHDRVPWASIDEFRLNALYRLLSHRGLISTTQRSDHPGPEPANAPLKVAEGSLWTEEEIQHLSLVWHRLPPWPDTCRGVELFNQHVPTVTLSNTSSVIINELVKNGRIPFTKVLSSDMFQSYKPNPKVYLGAAAEMGIKPEECGLIATHLYDPKAAKALGFFAIYVERPLEESHPELLNEGIPDMWITPDENGFVTVAQQLGWSTG